MSILKLIGVGFFSTLIFGSIRVSLSFVDCSCGRLPFVCRVSTVAPLVLMVEIVLAELGSTFIGRRAIVAGLANMPRIVPLGGPVPVPLPVVVDWTFGELTRIYGIILPEGAAGFDSFFK